jgi:hypothetical protein
LAWPGRYARRLGFRVNRGAIVALSATIVPQFADRAIECPLRDHRHT